MDCSTNQQLIPAKQCLDFLLTNANHNSLNNTAGEKIPLKKSLNRIVKTDVLAKINVPNFDNSAMDGYAINLGENLKPPYVFKIVGRVAAGEVGEEVPENCCVKIFTGAKLPQGANTIAILERCEVNNDSIEVFGFLQKGENIRPKGDDIKQGEIIVAAGEKLTPAYIGLCASIGVSEVEVFVKLKVGVFFSGDEIIEPDKNLINGKIYNSNRYSINALLQSLNFEVLDFGNIADDFATTCNALQELSTKCDAIITTGGVSVGEEDHIKPAVEKLGQILMWAINMKPGKPLAFGKIANTHFIGLPGNPVSAMATFHLFIKPFLRKLSGEKNYHNPTLKVQIDFAISPKSRREFMRARLDDSTIPPTASIYKNQSSGVLSSMSWADGLLEVADNKSFQQGDILDFYPL